MKKTRYIPYGYTIRNGITVIDRNEAEVVRDIFRKYIDGASLKELADELSARQIPYTEKNTEWDKARIARIIDNAKYIGEADYEPIIEADTYRLAVDTKTARKRNQMDNAVTGIEKLRNRMRCSVCGSMLIRRTCQQCRIRESWNCTNPDCGMHVRISDKQLLEKVNIIMNRIIRNKELLNATTESLKPSDSPAGQDLRILLDQEMKREKFSEETVMSLISGIAAERYRCENPENKIALILMKKRVEGFKEQDGFQETLFNEIAKEVLLDETGQIRVITKTEAEIQEE